MTRMSFNAQNYGGCSVQNYGGLAVQNYGGFLRVQNYGGVRIMVHKRSVVRGKGALFACSTPLPCSPLCCPSACETLLRG